MAQQSWVKVLLGLTMVGLCILFSFPTGFAQCMGDRQTGCWENFITTDRLGTRWPEAIHAAVVPVGADWVPQVLVWGCDVNVSIDPNFYCNDNTAKLWNPLPAPNGTFTNVPLVRTQPPCSFSYVSQLSCCPTGYPNCCSDGFCIPPCPPPTIFCSGHNFLEDGKVLVISGTIFDWHIGVEHAHGPLETFTFDPLAVVPGGQNPWAQRACLNDPVIGDLRGGRWYPTAVPLKRPAPFSDSVVKVWTFSGLNLRGRQDPPPNYASDVNNTVEMYDPAASLLGTWTRKSSNIPIDNPPAPEQANLYPRLHLLPSQNRTMWPAGLVLYSGGSKDNPLMRNWSWKFNPMVSEGPTGREAWSEVGPFAYDRKREDGTSAPLPIQLDATGVVSGSVRVLIVGGDNRPVKGADPDITATAEIFTDGSPGSWATAASMANARKHANAVLLPDGNALVVGGENCPTPPNCATCPITTALTPVYDAELFNPTVNPPTNPWTTIPAPAPAQRRPRQYHTTAVLLADGSVLVAGGDTDSYACPDPGPTAQIYKPGYFFRTARPVIGTLPTNIMNYNPNGNTRFTVPITVAVGEDMTRIQNVVLMKPSSVTHSFDSSQRAIFLTITARTTVDCSPTSCSGTVTVSTPGFVDIAQPGFYMLFVVKGIGNDQVLSIAKFIKLQ